MYRRILVPAQLPSEVYPLIRFASSLLDADGEIRLLHVIPSTSLPEVTRQWRASVNLVVPAHEAGAALDVRVEPEVRASVDVSGEILESAEAHQADAIVLALGGDKRSRRLFVGHTASAVLHHARSDVLVVNRLALAHTRVPRILVPTASGRAPSGKLARLAEELSARHDGVPVLPLVVGRKGGASSVREASSPRRFGPRSLMAEAFLGRRRQYAEAILEAAARERYGLLVVGDEDGAHGAAPMVTRALLEDLFRSAPCPVVAIRG